MSKENKNTIEKATEEVATVVNQEKFEERKKILAKIQELEAAGKFDIDAEDDPPAIELKPEMIDYLRRSPIEKIKCFIAYKIGEKFLNSQLKSGNLIIKEVKGIENLNNLKSGAVITCNHFNPFDSFTIEKVFKDSKQNRNHRLYKVIREGNYTNFPGLYGFLFKNANTLPLSSNRRTMMNFMDAVDKLLKKGEFILIYPEQSLWWNYRKPKPLKAGAFRFAAGSEVPVLPIFITMEDSSIIADDGFPIQEYTVNIGEPIYPDSSKSRKENQQMMMEKNSEIWKNTYEEFYNEKL